MRQTQCVQFYARASKANKAGLAPIECSIIINGARTIFNLPRKESPKVFNAKHRPQELEDYLTLQRREINIAQNFLIEHRMDVSPENIKKYLRGEIEVKKNNVGELSEDWLKVMKARVGKEITEDVYNKYQRTADIINLSLGKDTPLDSLKPGDIMMMALNIKARYKLSTSAGILTRVKSWLKFGQSEDRIHRDLWGRMKIEKGRPDIIFLTVEELARIKNRTWPCERLQKVADLSIFQANSGLSYVDLAELRPEDMQRTPDGQYYIQKKRHKTGQTFTAVILPDGMEIWNKYQGHLPILSNQRYNAYLDEIQDLCGIKKKLHTHIFRKTYGCNLLRLRVPIEVVSKALGHQNTLITQAAYADLLAVDICKTVAEKLSAIP